MFVLTLHARNLPNKHISKFSCEWDIRRQYLLKDNEFCIEIEVVFPISHQLAIYVHLLQLTSWPKLEDQNRSEASDFSVQRWGWNCCWVIPWVMRSLMKLWMKWTLFGAARTFFRSVCFIKFPSFPLLNQTAWWLSFPTAKPASKFPQTYYICLIKALLRDDGQWSRN